MRTSCPLAVAAVLALGSCLAACRSEGCLAGDVAECRVPAPCTRLSFDCAGGFAEARVLRPGDRIPGGPAALAAPGDVLLGNDQVAAVVDALDHPHYLAPTGGNLLDLGTRRAGEEAGDDQLNQILEAVGILPGDEVRWTALEIVDSGPEVAAIQVRGTLDGRPRVHVATRFEVRACEPGIRVRTEAVNLGGEPELWLLTDGFYWGGHEILPFTPIRGEGFVHEEIDLEEIDGQLRSFPWVAGTSHAPPYTGYASVACNAPSLSGFDSDTVSAAGLAKRVVMPGDHAILERFIAAVPAAGLASPADLAMEIRARLFGEPFVTLRGRLARPAGPPLGAETSAAVVVSELPRDGAPAVDRTPWSEAVPGADGAFAVRVPPHRRYLLDVQAFGTSVASVEVAAQASDVDLGEIVVQAAGRLDLAVLDSSGTPIDARVVLAPADAATRAATAGSLFGASDACTPMLGPPYGPSPACNVVLVPRDRPGPLSIWVPSGSYVVLATAGPFSALDRRTITVGAAPVALDLLVDPIPGLQPPGTLSADLHVHGRASFDAVLPDQDRLLSFAAAGVDVVAATDHDVVGHFDPGSASPGSGRPLTVLGGVETTGHIPWFTIPGSIVPRVIGHWNFWPLAFDPEHPRRGAPDDERVWPGALFERVAPLFTSPGVIQLNHPWSSDDFGRATGWAYTLELDCRRPLPDRDDGSTRGLFVATPPGTATRSDAYHAQEVMNGSRNTDHLKHRAFWFYLLDQGIVRAGTANSDSSDLAVDTVGTPRNLVWTDTHAGPDFDPAAFAEAVRAGRLVGTNGPVIEASLTSASAPPVGPGTRPLSPAPDAALAVRVSGAPWVPIRELRIVVNGAVARRVPLADAEPRPLERFRATWPLAQLLPPGARDAWIVVEAGEPLPLAADLDGDGIPDTGDNDGNGVVDRRDVAEGEDEGPLDPPLAPTDPDDPRFAFAALSSGGLPQAFTNPFLLDLDGDGRFGGPGLPGSPP